jgi:hypothetical protein
VCWFNIYIISSSFGATGVPYLKKRAWPTKVLVINKVVCSQLAKGTNNLHELKEWERAIKCQEHMIQWSALCRGRYGAHILMDTIVLPSQTKEYQKYQQRKSAKLQGETSTRKGKNYQSNLLMLYEF